MGAAPGEVAARIGHEDLPTGEGDRFAGYGVMGQPFRSGHVLVMRRFPHNTLGDAYTSVWHCAPDGRWTLWNDAPAHLSCPRYFGSDLAAAVETPIGLTWPDPSSLRVQIEGVLDWSMRIAPTPATRAMSTVAGRLPARLWRSSAVLAVMGRSAGPMLRAGTVRFAGRLPTEQRFRVRIPNVWATADVDATLHGRSLGPAGRGPVQRRLGDFALPNRGLFAAGSLVIESFEPARHRMWLPLPSSDGAVPGMATTTP